MAKQPQDVALNSKDTRTADNSFIDLGQGTCSLSSEYQGPNETPKPKVSRPLQGMNGMLEPGEMKEACKKWCFEKSAPKSLANQWHCWGFSIDEKGTCLIWKEGPLELG